MSVLKKQVKLERRLFVYNPENALLQYVAEKDEVMDDGYVICKKGDVIQSIGCNLEDWKEDPDGMAYEFNYQLDAELEIMMQQLKQELS